MNEMEIRQWHEANGIDYIEDDWGDRFDTGESAVALSTDREGLGPREQGNVFLLPFFSENVRLVGAWGRDPEAQRRAEALEDFFAPYLAMLPTRQGDLVRQLMNDQLTLSEMAKTGRLYDRSHAQKNLRSALRALTRLIANDDPDFEPTNRPRDYEAEAAAAERVFDRYWRDNGDA